MRYSVVVVIVIKVDSLIQNDHRFVSRRMVGLFKRSLYRSMFV